MKEINERLREAREALGLTQTQAAQILDVSGNTIARWESGYLIPKGDNAYKVEEFINLTTDNNTIKKIKKEMSNNGIVAIAGAISLMAIARISSGRNIGLSSLLGGIGNILGILLKDKPSSQKNNENGEK